jgi:hypothetical protein
LWTDSLYGEGGEKLNVYKFKAYAAGSLFGGKEPFEGEACRLENSGSMPAVYFAREMFKAGDGLNHQASYGFVINKDTFERLYKESKTGYNATSAGNMTMPYVSHWTCSLAPVGCRPSLAKCYAFCVFKRKLFGNLRFPNNSIPLTSLFFRFTAGLFLRIMEMRLQEVSPSPNSRTGKIANVF